MSKQNPNPTNKRDYDRRSGTGRPIKEAAKRGGSGKANWGDDQELIDAAVAQKENQERGGIVRKSGGAGIDDPQNMGDLSNTAPKEETRSWDDYQKSKKNKQENKAYDSRTVASGYKKKYNANKREKVTDSLFAGAESKKNKRKRNKKKAKKRYIQPQIKYATEENQRQDRRGQGRGRGRGQQGNRGYNDRGYNQRSRYGSGFGGRGRGTRVSDDRRNNFQRRDDINNAQQSQPQSNAPPVSAPTQAPQVAQPQAVLVDQN